MKKYLTESQSVLFTSKLEISADENKHTAGRSRWLTIDGGDAVFALLEREGGELGDDVLRALDLLAFKGQHGSILIQIS